jgi:ATP-dependent Clp protease protease subunit
MAREVLRLKASLNQFFADATGQPLEVIQRDTDRDFYMTAEQAVTYGLIDKVLAPPVKSGSTA